MGRHTVTAKTEITLGRVSSLCVCIIWMNLCCDGHVSSELNLSRMRWSMLKFKRFLRQPNLVPVVRITLFIVIFLSLYFILLPKRQKRLSEKYAKWFHDLNPVNKSWGQDGEGVQLDEHTEAIAEETFALASFNVYISDRIRLVLVVTLWPGGFKGSNC